MKLYLAVLIIGAVVGGYIATIFFPKIVENTKTEYKDKIVTVTKEVRAKDGSIIKETTRTEDKKGTIATPIERKNLIGGSALLNGGYEVMYARKVFTNTYLSIGATTDKELKAGIIIEF